ncbi:MAG: GAF domain-containing protein [Verrucomicrobiales bacterium]|nr:GAF domain-containing protein [Verrucomicrobiales bacterium]
MTVAADQALLDRIQRLEAVNAAALAVHASLEPKESLQQLVAEAVRLTGASSGSLVLRNPNSSLLEIEAAIGLPPAAAVLRLPLGKGITGWVALHGKPARVGDVRADPRYLMVRPEVRSELAVPMLVDGEVRGVLNVDSEQVDAFSEPDAQVLDELARHAVIVVRNTWLFEQARRRTSLSTALAGIARAMNQAVGLDEILQLITREATELMGAKLCSVLMIGADPDALEVRASSGAGPDYLGRGRLSVDESLVGVVLRRRRPLQVEDVRSSRLYQSTEVARREGLVSLLSVPLVLGGEARGVLNIYSGEPHTFSNEEIQTLSALAELSAIALERARLSERMGVTEDQLRQSDKLSALGLLAAEVAHEIRNPLTVMKMLYHSLDLRFPAGDPRSEDARVIGQKMDLLNRIVEQVLDFARHAEPRLEVVSVGVLLEDLRLLTRHKLRVHGVELRLAVPEETPGLRADPVQLEQAFLNLILNAVDAMPSGGLLTIRAEVQRAPSNTPELVLTVADTGTGMLVPSEAGKTGFLLGSKKPGGTGLGLAIVTRVVEAHRGRISFESKPGVGTTITLRFPVHSTLITE